MRSTIKISGLMKFADVVRRELSAPAAPAQRVRLQSRVAEFVRRVDLLLIERRAKIEHVPTPSRRAYQFLTNIDWSAPTVPAVSSAAAEPSRPKNMHSWRGLTAFLDRAMNALAADLAPQEFSALGQAIARSSRTIELGIQRDNITPDQLNPTTRAQRGWLAFFGREDNLAAYAAARKSAGDILNPAATASRHFPPPLTIHFRPMRSIYKMRATRPGAVLWLPVPMIGFDPAMFAELAAMVFQRSGHARQRVIEAMAGEAYQTIYAELESLGGIAEQTRGVAHDLAASFDRVNAAYFNGTMKRPRLTWNRTFTGRKFGHYDFIRDTVMVTRTLDSAAVPEFVVDFLMFHELLHKFHGTHWVNGRGYAHTAEFYESERKFARYWEAEEFLQKLARRMG